MAATIRYPQIPRDWDSRFLLLARQVAGWSKDPSTKVGAVAVRDRRILATGYNGFPAGVRDDPMILSNRELRLASTVHAEANVIAYAARDGVCLLGSTIYIWPLAPCSQCACKLIQAGIASIVFPRYVMPMRWEENFRLARKNLVEAGVGIRTVEIPYGPLDHASPDD